MAQFGFSETVGWQMPLSGTVTDWTSPLAVRSALIDTQAPQDRYARFRAFMRAGSCTAGEWHDMWPPSSKAIVADTQHGVDAVS